MSQINGMEKMPVEEIIQKYQILEKDLSDFTAKIKNEQHAIIEFMHKTYKCEHLSYEADGDIWCANLHDSIDCCWHFRCRNFKPVRKK